MRCTICARRRRAEAREAAEADPAGSPVTRRGSRCTRGPRSLLCQRSICLPAAPTSQNDRHRLQHDANILRHRLTPDVLEIVLHLLPDVLERSVVVMIDLCQPGDARPGPLSQRILGDMLA